MRAGGTGLRGGSPDIGSTPGDVTRVPDSLRPAGTD